MRALRFRDVGVEYDGRKVLSGISFDLDHPSILSIMGPNGAGKTTLLKVILGIIPYEGEVLVFGFSPRENLWRIRSLVGYVPQRERISAIPMKVRDVVLMGLLTKKKFPRHPSEKDLEEAREALEMVGMKEHWESDFRFLSGGQQQRVLIARSLASRPKMLLLDEPMNGVDVKTQKRIMDFLKMLRDEYETSVVIVTHEINLLAGYSDRVMVLNREIVGYGEPKNTLTKENLQKVYGTAVTVIEGLVCPVVFTGDTHA